MVAWSLLSRNLALKTPFKAIVGNQNALLQMKKELLVPVRHGGHGPENFHIHPSNWQWDKFKDMLHYYILVGLIPVLSIVTYVNIFVGPAKLAPTPENYEPKHWEYYKHPITRFLARYIVRNPQQEYEKMCHELYEESEKIRLRRLERDVKRLMAQRNDYQAWYYRPAMVKYARHSKEFFDEDKYRIGDV